MDITSIIQEYGAYYERSSQNMSRLKTLLLQGAVTTGLMTPIKTEDTIYRLGNSSISSLLQGFQKGWTPRGGVKIIPNEIRLRHMKFDFEETPDDLEASWLGFLASPDHNRKDWPFVKWLMEVHLVPKLKQELELNAYGKGVYSAPTPGTANDPGDVMDGLKTLLQAGLDSDGTTQGVINHISGVGALDKTTVFDQIETFVDGISSVYQTQAMDVCVPYEFARAYMRDKRAQGFYDLPGDRYITNGIDFTPQQVVGLPSLAGETFIFATPKSNMFHATKKAANKTNFKVEELKRQVFIMSDWYEGIGFGINEAVFTTLEPTPEPDPEPDPEP